MTTEPPPGLNDEGRRIWRDTLAQLMQAGTRADPNSLLAYVEAVRQNRRATQLINQSDILINRDGRPTRNPLLDIQRETAQTIANFARQFKLNQTTTNTEPNTTQPTPPPHGRYCLTHNRNECIGLNSNQTQCHNTAVYGLMHCERHAGVNIKTSPAHLLALQQRKNPIHGEPKNLPPDQVMLWRVRQVAGEVERLDAYLAGLTGDEKVVVREVEGPDGTKRYYETLLTIWSNHREKRENVLRSECQAALQAGVEERLVRIAETQAADVHHAFLALLGDFGIPADDPRIAELLPRRIRELTA